MLRGVGLSPAGTVILLQLSLGVDLGSDSGNTPGHWSESLVKQLPSWPCQKSRGWWSGPAMTCWLQMMTCEHLSLTGDQSTSQWAPEPPSSAPFQAAAWGRSTPQVPLSPAWSHWLLQWWGAGRGICNWGHGWTSVLPPCWPLLSATSASPPASLGMWWSTSRCLYGHLPRGHWMYPWWHQACPCMTELPLDFVVQNWGSHLGHHQGLWWLQVALMPCHCSGNLPKEGATLGLLLPKQGKLCFWVQNTSLCRVHDFDLLTNPWSVFYTNQSPSSIHCLWSISGYSEWSQHCWSKENPLWVSTVGTLHVRLQEKPSWKFWNDIRTHSQSYIKMYN